MGSNFGWYIIPFSVNANVQEQFKNSLDEKYDSKTRFNNCKYLFSYVTNMFRGEDPIVKSYDIPDEIYKDYCFNSYLDYDFYKEASITDVELDLFNPYLGFLSFKINYGEMNVEQIEKFTYEVKKLYIKENVEPYDNLVILTNEILGKKFVKPFFYSLDNASNVCNVFQMIYIKDKSEYTSENIFALQRGVTRGFLRNDEANEESNVDLFYKPYKYIEWYGCQNVLCCLVKEFAANVEDNKNFVHNFLPISINNDYLCMYLILLNERYATMYLLSRLIDYRDSDYKTLYKIDDELNYFQINLSFNIVSNEMVYQNLYCKLYKIFNVDNLIKDVEESEKRLMLQRQKLSEKREKNINIILTALSLLVVGSALIDITSFMDRIFKNESFMNWIISLVIVVILVAISIVRIIILNKKDKYDEGRKIK